MAKQTTGCEQKYIFNYICWELLCKIIKRQREKTEQDSVIIR